MSIVRSAFFCELATRTEKRSHNLHLWYPNFQRSKALATAYQYRGKALEFDRASKQRSNDHAWTIFGEGIEHFRCLHYKRIGNFKGKFCTTSDHVLTATGLTSRSSSSIRTAKSHLSDVRTNQLAQNKLHDKEVKHTANSNYDLDPAKEESIRGKARKSDTIKSGGEWRRKKNRSSTPRIPHIKHSRAHERMVNLEQRQSSNVSLRRRVIRKTKDPLVVHLRNVAGSPAYRTKWQSVIVAGLTLIKELLQRFRCKRVMLRPKVLHRLFKFSGSEVEVKGAADNISQPLNDSSYESIFSCINLPQSPGLELHFTSNHILKKISGLHSYEDGCVAEFRAPIEAETFGNIRLLLCLGKMPASFCSDDLGIGMHNSMAQILANWRSALGTAGTLIRTAAALQWQGIWILPQCPDILDPLSIRASQGALYWIPYKRGTVQELEEFCRKEELSLCAPHWKGASLCSTKFPSSHGKGICLVLDEEFMVANKSVKCGANSSLQWNRHTLEKRILISCGDENYQECIQHALQPVVATCALMYHLRSRHFPNVGASPYVFSIRKKQRK